MKDTLDKAFSSDGSYLKPAHRFKIGNSDVLIADGFVPVKHLPRFQQVFGGAMPDGKIARDEFPNGCYATIWLVPGRAATQTGVLVFAPDHDGESLNVENKKRARINRAMQIARDSLNKKIH